MYKKISVHSDRISPIHARLDKALRAPYRLRIIVFSPGELIGLLRAERAGHALDDFLRLFLVWNESIIHFGILLNKNKHK